MLSINHSSESEFITSDHLPSVSLLYKQFFTRQQDPVESILSFARDLESLRQDIQQFHSTVFDDILIRDHFIYHLHDVKLKQELLRYIHRNPSSTFEDVCKEVRAYDATQGHVFPLGHIFQGSNSSKRNISQSPSVSLQLPELPIFTGSSDSTTDIFDFISAARDVLTLIPVCSNYAILWIKHGLAGVALKEVNYFLRDNPSKTVDEVLNFLEQRFNPDVHVNFLFSKFYPRKQQPNENI
jgi:hypothetical protein